MSDIFVSYARSTEVQARQVADALRALGHAVWRDDELPAHRSYAEVIEERLKAAKAVVVIWSAEAVKSAWVQSEADRARGDQKLVQLRVDEAALPMPFDRIQCADLTGWNGDTDAPGWRKVVGSIAALIGGSSEPAVSSSAASNVSVLALPSKPSIAVLPFTNLSADPEQEYFADGMVEEITAALSRSKALFVIASASGLSLKGKALGPSEAGQLLGVRYLLDGSVRKAGGRVRIAVRLLDAGGGEQLWAERFDDTLVDVFALQDRIALAVAGAIEPGIQNAEIRRTARRPTLDMNSYDLYLRAVAQYRSVSTEGLRSALDLLEQALAIDPDDGRVLALAAFCHGVLGGRAGFDRAHQTELARELGRRALKAAGDDAEVLARVSNSMGADGGVEALRLVERAIALNPGSSYVWLASAWRRLWLGEPELCIEHLQTSMRLDPLSPWRDLQLHALGLARLAQRHFGEAATLLEEAISLNAEVPFRHLVLVACYGHLGQRERAQQALSRWRTLEGVLPEEEHARIVQLGSTGALGKVVLEGIELAGVPMPAGPES
jgi:adenylate cyclase